MGPKPWPKNYPDDQKVFIILAFSIFTQDVHGFWVLFLETVCFEGDCNFTDRPDSFLATVQMHIERMLQLLGRFYDPTFQIR